MKLHPSFSHDQVVDFFIEGLYPSSFYNLVKLGMIDIYNLPACVELINNTEEDDK